jgi:leucyl-tRNA synthetase
MPYPFTEIEAKWQEYWRQAKTFHVPTDPSKPKYFTMDMFAYPSGAGLHMGHPMGYTGSDITARYKRMRGFNVLHPMGWDAFGLPAEQFAVKNKMHPAITTAKNVATFKRQLESLGFAYDWSREVNTTDPSYFKWTQWIFLKMFNSYFDNRSKCAAPISALIHHIEHYGTKDAAVDLPDRIQHYTASEWKHASAKQREDFLQQCRLAYISDAPVNWCPELGTVLANEEVAEQEEKGFTVIRRNMRQWMMRITAYADRLIEDLALLNWPESTLEMQRNWIGKSIGAEIDFAIAGVDEPVRVFTTRPDTLFGATYMVLAPEHPLVDRITSQEQREAVTNYLDEVKRKSDLERTDLAKDKTGVFTGAYAINPATEQPIPVWIADYVLITYGTGAIMSVPGHDERDFEFAQKFDLPIVRVVASRSGEGQPKEDFSQPLEEAMTEEGVAVNSGLLDGLPTPDAKTKMIEWIESKRLGKRAVKYKLRDWLFSRQRYWGEPFPIIYLNDGDGDYPKALPEQSLPVTLPVVESYSPSGTGESPLATMPEWVNTTDPETGKPARRETNTMPQWAGSCWYYLRYLDPNNDRELISKEAEKYWMPVDLYVGGTEHAVTHLLYSRFWHKVLFDYDVVSTPEPFTRLFHQGMLLGENGVKMSKSLGNVVNPDEYLERFGADTLRMYVMFLGPLEMMKPWDSQGINGVNRFLNRIWRLVMTDEGTPHEILDKPMSKALERTLHQTIKKVSEDIEALRLNTAISAMMILLNQMTDEDGGVPRTALDAMLKLLNPFAPHITEEIWQQLGHREVLANSPWPEYDESKTIEDTVTLILQVNGKVRDKLEVPRGLTREELESFASQSEKLQKHVGAGTIRKVIVVPDKLVNVVVS